MHPHFHLLRLECFDSLPNVSFSASVEGKFRGRTTQYLSAAQVGEPITIGISHSATAHFDDQSTPLCHFTGTTKLSTSIHQPKVNTLDLTSRFLLKTEITWLKEVTIMNNTQTGWRRIG